MKVKEYTKKEEANARVFNIFSALFCQPNSDSVSNQQVFNALYAAFEIASPECTNHVSELRDSLSKYSGEELLVEYSRLFIGPFKMLAPPYSSMYFDGGTLMSDETLWVINFYKKLGLKFNTDLKEAPDHVSIESEFMYYLIYNGIKHLMDDNLEQAQHYFNSRDEFFQNHYVKWVLQFCDKVKENTNNDYYLNLSICFNKFIAIVEMSSYSESTKSATT